MTELSWNWKSSVKNAFISISSVWEFLRPELLRVVVLQGAALSGKAHSKLTSGRKAFPSLLRESCVTADVPSDPCSMGALISWCFLHPPSNTFSWERCVCDPISMAVPLITGFSKFSLSPWAAPAAGSSPHKCSIASVSSWNLKPQWCRVGLDLLTILRNWMPGKRSVTWPIFVSWESIISWIFLYSTSEWSPE